MTGPWMWTYKLVCLHPQYITSYKLQMLIDKSVHSYTLTVQQANKQSDVDQLS